MTRWEMDYDLLENEGLFDEYLEMSKLQRIVKHPQFTLCAYCHVVTVRVLIGCNSLPGIVHIGCIFMLLLLFSLSSKSIHPSYTRTHTHVHSNKHIDVSLTYTYIQKSIHHGHTMYLQANILIYVPTYLTYTYIHTYIHIDVYLPTSHIHTYKNPYIMDTQCTFKQTY